MFKTFKNILAVAVSISLLTISNAVADGHMAAIKKWSNGESLVFQLFLQKKERKNLIGSTMLQNHSKEWK